MTNTSAPNGLIPYSVVLNDDNSEADPNAAPIKRHVAKQFNFNFDVDLHQRIKVQAAREGITMCQLIHNALEEYLAAHAV